MNTASNNNIKTFLETPNGKLVIYSLIFWSIIIFTLGILTTVYLLPNYFLAKNDNTSSSSSQFEKCLINGGIIEETYPRVCRIDGNLYTEEINHIGPSNKTFAEYRSKNIDLSTNSPFFQSKSYQDFQDYYFNNATYRPIKPSAEWASNTINFSLPFGWKKQEVRFEDQVQNVNGIESSDTLYGLSEITITNERNLPVLVIKGLISSPNNSVCEEIYKFPDSNPLYIEYRKAINSDYVNKGNELSTNVVEVNDYTDISFLNSNLRRSGTSLFKDYMSGDKFFDSECGNGNQINNYDFIGYSTEYDKSTGYSTGIKLEIQSNLTNFDLTRLDSILNSAKVEKVL